MFGRGMVIQIVVISMQAWIILTFWADPTLNTDIHWVYHLSKFKTFPIGFVCKVYNANNVVSWVENL